MTATLAPPHPDTETALDAARNLIRSGVPVFVAPPRPDAPPNKLPFHLPNDWQLTEPDEGALGAWQPGWAVCAVMGQGLDLVDHDPRNEKGVDPLETIREAGELPEVVAEATTPSGGTHRFVRSMGLASCGDLLPGLDIKAGQPNGEGRGFAFIAPTEKASKVTGEIRPYVWTTPPPPSLAAYPVHTDPALALARRVRAAQHKLPTPEAGGAPPTAAGTYAAASAPRNEHTGPIPDGSRHAALVSYAGYLRTRGVGPDLAGQLMLLRLADCAQPPEARSPVTPAEALEKLHDVYHRYDGGTPDLTTVEVDENGARINPLLARLFDREALRSIPPVRWLIQGTLPEHSVTVLSGRTQTLKTFLALDLALSHATGGEWFGRVAGHGRVLLVLAEGFEGIAGRIEAWEAEHGPVPPETLTVLRGAVQLADGQQVADLCEIVTEGGYSVVVVDTYAKSTLGLVENSNDDATTATAALYRIADATREGRGAVLVIAHATKYRDENTGKRTARGAGALTDNIDGQYDLERISETEVLVERVKVKEAELHDTFRMTFRASGPSIVLDYAEIDPADVPVRQSTQRQETDRGIARALRVLGEGKALDAAAVAARIETSTPTARGYLQRLVESGSVQLGGTAKHQFYSLSPP